MNKELQLPILIPVGMHWECSVVDDIEDRHRRDPADPLYVPPVDGEDLHRDD